MKHLAVLGDFAVVVVAVAELLLELLTGRESSASSRDFWVRELLPGIAFHGLVLSISSCFLHCNGFEMGNVFDEVLRMLYAIMVFQGEECGRLIVNDGGYFGSDSIVLLHRRNLGGFGLIYIFSCASAPEVLSKRPWVSAWHVTRHSSSESGSTMVPLMQRPTRYMRRCCLSSGDRL